jgi:hypothetical protein
MNHYISPEDTKIINDLKASAAGIKPDAEFIAVLEMQLLNPAQPSLNGDQASPKMALRKHGWQQRVRIASAIAAVFAVCVTATLSIPPLRAIAQEVIDTLFNRTETNKETIEFGPHGILQLVPFYFGSVEQAQEKVDFEIHAPTLVPDDLALRIVNYSPEENLLSLLYGHPGEAYISPDLSVFLGPVKNGWSNQSYFTIGASADIVSVEFSGITGQVIGEFVQGFWVFPPAYQWPEEITSVAVEWDSNLPLCRLRWQEDDMLYEIWSPIWSNIREKDAVSCPLSQAEMIAIAESME